MTAARRRERRRRSHWVRARPASRADSFVAGARDLRDIRGGGGLWGPAPSDRPVAASAGPDDRPQRRGRVSDRDSHRMCGILPKRFPGQGSIDGWRGVEMLAVARLTPGRMEDIRTPTED